jgi:hypothetical protein
MNNKLQTLDQKPIQEITERIKLLHSELLGSLKTSFEKAMQIGQILTDFKGSVQHGEFMPFLKTLPFSDRTARNYIWIYYNKDKLKTETIASLTDAYKFLAKYYNLAEIGEKVKDPELQKRLIAKGVKECWNEKKTRVILEAIVENPNRQEHILNCDLSDENEGIWKQRLLIAIEKKYESLAEIRERQPKDDLTRVNPDSIDYRHIRQPEHAKREPEELAEEQAGRRINEFRKQLNLTSAMVGGLTLREASSYDLEKLEIDLRLDSIVFSKLYKTVVAALKYPRQPINEDGLIKEIAVIVKNKKAQAEKERIIKDDDMVVDGEVVVSPAPVTNTEMEEDITKTNVKNLVGEEKVTGGQTVPAETGNGKDTKTHLEKTI